MRISSRSYPSLALLLLTGCSAVLPTEAEHVLAAHFPAHAERLLGPHGHPAPRPAAEAEPAAPFEPLADAAAVPEPQPLLRARFPERTGDPIVFAREDGFTLRVFPEGARGPARLTGATGSTLTYDLPNGTSYWVVEGRGYEEWILVPSPRPGKVASWRIEGGTFEQRGEAVRVVDARGRPRVSVTAPAAFGPGGAPVNIWLVAEGERLALHTDAEEGPVLIDPYWLPTDTMAAARSHHASTTLPGGSVLVTGGFSVTPRVPIAGAEIYSPTLSTWSAAASMPIARTRHAQALMNDGRVLVVAGLSTTGATDQVHAYTPATNTWQARAAISGARANHTATLLPDGRVLVAGGSNQNTFLNSAQVYNPTLNAWGVTLFMNATRSFHTATLLPNGQVLVVGGTDGTTPLASTETFSEPAGVPTWTIRAPMTTARERHTATLLSDGRVLVVGGSNNSFAQLASAEIYNPATNTWSPTGSLSFARTEHTATLLPDGRVLVTGGRSPVLTRAETWDPTTGLWTRTGCMLEARANHTANRLPDGQVLVAGGMNVDSLATSEIHDPAGALPLGALCVSGCECASESCVDGVCCDTACAGACDACNLPGQAGTCGLVASGSAGAPSCSPYLCNGAQATCPSTCASDAACAALHYCTSASACVPQLNNGQACSTQNQCLSGFCVDGVCCNSACDEGCDACNLLGQAGTCTLRSTGAAGAPSCTPYVCDGQTAPCPTTCTTDANCISSHHCSNNTCVPKRPQADPCAAGNECLSSFCADGLCCTSACGEACNSCDQPGSEGTCTLSPAGHGGAPSCGAYVCLGTGPNCPNLCLNDSYCAQGHFCENNACVPKRPIGAACTAQNQCLSDHCVDGFCCDTACADACDACNVAGSEGTCSPVAQGQPGAPSCVPYLCDGTQASCPNSCVQDPDCAFGYRCAGNVCIPRTPNGGPCTDSFECLSGVCQGGICCDRVCNGACEACDLPGVTGTCSPVAAGNPGAPSCAPYVCSGATGTCPGTCSNDTHCVADHFCDTASSTCVPRRPLGQPCTGPNQCASNFCVDGVCCDGTCDGPCEACNLPGSVGTCTVTPAGTPGQPSCAPYLCDGTGSTCPGGCTTDAQCVTGHFCDAGVCKPRRPNGSTCTEERECASAFCVDGVCCDTACTGDCAACDLPGKEGTCSPVPPGDPGTPACTPYVCTGNLDCPTTCTSSLQCAPGFHCEEGQCRPGRPIGEGCSQDSDCDSGLCVDGVCCDTACTGGCEACNLPGLAGTCSTVPAGTQMPACGAVLCDGRSTECLASCNDDGACAADFVCEGGACVDRNLRPVGYIGWGCASTGTGPGAGLVLLLAVAGLFLRRRRSAALGAGAVACLLLTSPLAHAQAPANPPPASDQPLGRTEPGRFPAFTERLHVGGAFFGDAISRQVGAEVGASYSLLPFLDLGGSGTLGRYVGYRFLGTLHRPRTPGVRLSPFAQVRALVHPVRTGVGAGGGAWLGATYELGPGRIRAGAMGEVYRGPPGFLPYSISAMAGYELDPFRSRVERQVVTRDVVVTREVPVEVPAPVPTTAGFQARVTDLEDKVLEGELTVEEGPEGVVGERWRPGEAPRRDLPPGKYRIRATAEGHLARARPFELVAGETVVAEFPLRPAPAQSQVALTSERIEVKQTIQFAFNEATLLPESHGVLDEVVDVLLRHPKIQLRIEGHTDDRGDPAYNLQLSRERARAVLAYLVDKGVKPERLASEGFGASRPVVKGKTEKARAVNRRVQFEIVSQ
jgi:uncharacterized protein (TIGR03382 family)